MLYRIQKLIACIGVLICFVSVIPARAADFTVGTPQELIDAINAANANSEADTITLTADITLNTIDNNDDLTGDGDGDGNTGLPAITSEITINGNQFTIQRDTSANEFRILSVGNSGALTLRNTGISNGRISLPLYPGFGAGIISLGDTILINSNIFNNSAGSGGGIFHGGDSLTVINSTISENSSRGGGTGILHRGNTLIIQNSIISRNISSAGSGGGLSGGGFLMITNSTISENSAYRVGGGIATGGSPFNPGPIIIRNSIISDNSVFGTDSGTGIGGGISNGGGNVLIASSSIYNNDAYDIGGGIANNGDMTLIDSALSGNLATNGGGIYNGGVPGNTGSLIITNTTFSDNSATNGGGIRNFALLDIINSTFSGNSASNPGGGISNSDGPVTIENSIIAASTDVSGNPTDACFNEGTLTITNSLDDDNSCTGTGEPRIRPGIDYDTTFADNGGPTRTHALLGSTNNLAVNPDNGNTNPPPADQRGALAVNDRDIGAYEFQGTPQSVSFTVDEPALTEGGSVTQATVRLTVANFSTEFDVSIAFTGDVIDADYTTTYSGPYTITENGTTEFTINIVDDALTEGTETLTLNMLVNGAAGTAGTNPQSIAFLDAPPALPTEEPQPTENPLPGNDQPQPTQDVSALHAVEELPTTGESPFWRNWLIIVLLLLSGAGGMLFIRKRTQHTTR